MPEIQQNLAIYWQTCSIKSKEYQKPLSRVERLKERLEEENTTDVEDIMMTIMDIFNDTVTPVPDVGNFYTFIYQPKTPKIQYDQQPLIACTDIFRWGFRGINFHWQSPRNYTWGEVVEVVCSSISGVR